MFVKLLEMNFVCLLINTRAIFLTSTESIARFTWNCRSSFKVDGGRLSFRAIL